MSCLLNDEPLRICVPLLMGPWTMQACHPTFSCHLGTARTMRKLKRLNWWVGMSVCTRWWLRHCLKCQARKPRGMLVRWLTVSIPLPEGPGIVVSVDCLGPLPVTPCGNTNTLLFTDRFRRRAVMFTVAQPSSPLKAPLTLSSTGILSDKGLQFCSKLSPAVCQPLRVRKIATRSYHPNGITVEEWNVMKTTR